MKTLYTVTGAVIGLLLGIFIYHIIGNYFAYDSSERKIAVFLFPAIFCVVGMTIGEYCWGNKNGPRGPGFFV